MDRGTDLNMRLKISSKVTIVKVLQEVSLATSSYSVIIKHHLD